MSRTVTTLPFIEKEVATGNYDETRTTIDRVIIHTMVGTADSAASRFDSYGSHVSAHYGVKLDGTLYHFLEETFTAYHAGSYSMNQRSIGIEHEDNGDYNGVRTDALYTESAKLVRDICLFYNIPIDRQHILKHSEIIPTGCPDALDIDRIVKEAQATVTEQVLVDSLRNDRDRNYKLWKSLCELIGVQVSDSIEETQYLAHNAVVSLLARPVSCPAPDPTYVKLYNTVKSFFSK